MATIPQHKKDAPITMQTTIIEMVLSSNSAGSFMLPPAVGPTAPRGTKREKQRVSLRAEQRILEWSEQSWCQATNFSLFKKEMNSRVNFGLFSRKMRCI